MKKVFVLSFLFFTKSFTLLAQAKINTVGIQIRPIIPSDLFVSGAETFYQENVAFDVTLQSGFSAGMLIRHGFSDLLALETGINYVKRIYNLKITDGNFIDESDFRIIGYEIPVNLLVYIRLGEKTFMNASMGPAIDMFASDVQSYNDYYEQTSYRNQIFLPAVNANLGWEYRTAKSGYFYIGASYHRPFSYIYVTSISYLNREPVLETLAGNYLTIDFRYFFHEDPKKKVKQRNTDE